MYLFSLLPGTSQYSIMVFFFYCLSRLVMRDIMADEFLKILQQLLSSDNDARKAAEVSDKK